MKPSSSRVAKKWKSLPKGWTDESVKKFWKGLTGRAPKHPVKRCIREMDGKVSNPGAFCGGLADWMIPGWREEAAKDKKAGLEVDSFLATDGMWYVQVGSRHYGPFWSDVAAIKKMVQLVPGTLPSADGSGERRPPKSAISPKKRRWASALPASKREIREASVNLRVLDAAVRNLFERGSGKFSKRLYCDYGGPCGVVADAIHEVVGGKKLGVCAKQWEGEEGPQHIVVRVAPGKVVDAWGVVSDQQMLETWGRFTAPDTWKEEGWYFCDLSRSGTYMPNDIGRNPALSAEMADALRQEISRLEGGRTARGKDKKASALPASKREIREAVLAVLKRPGAQIRPQIIWALEDYDFPKTWKKVQQISGSDWDIPEGQHWVQWLAPYIASDISDVRDTIPVEGPPPRTFVRMIEQQFEGARLATQRVGASVNRDADKLLKDLRALKVDVNVGGGPIGGHITVYRPIKPRALSNQVSRLFSDAAEGMSGAKIRKDRHGITLTFRGTTTEVLRQQEDLAKALKDFFPKSRGQFYKELAAAMKGKIPDHLVEEIRMGAQTDRLYETWDQIREGIEDAPMDLTRVPRGTWIEYFAEEIADGIVGLASWANNAWNFGPGEAPPKVDPEALYDKVFRATRTAASTSRVARKWAATHLWITFYECEHSGDMQAYIDDIVTSGGRVTVRSHNFDDEECSLQVEMRDRREFMRRFEKTDAYEFSSLADY